MRVQPISKFTLVKQNMEEPSSEVRNRRKRHDTMRLQILCHTSMSYGRFTSPYLVLALITQHKTDEAKAIIKLKFSLYRRKRDELEEFVGVVSKTEQQISSSLMTGLCQLLGRYCRQKERGDFPVTFWEIEALYIMQSALAWLSTVVRRVVWETKLPTVAPGTPYRHWTRSSDKKSSAQSRQSTGFASADGATLYPSGAN